MPATEYRRRADDLSWETGTHNRGQTEVANRKMFRGKRDVTDDELLRVRGVEPPARRHPPSSAPRESRGERSPTLMRSK